MIERSQYRENNIVYENGGFGDLGLPLGSKPEFMEGRDEPLSFLEYMLIGTVSQSLFCDFVDCGCDIFCGENILATVQRWKAF